MEFATIGTALSSRRKSLNIGQARAAEIIGMSRTTFSSYEHDLQRPSAEVLPSLAKFLEISIDDVLILYGGTCIEALRPSLDKILAAQGDTKVHTSVDVESSTTPDASASVTPEPRISRDSDLPASAPATLNEPVAVAAKDASVSIFANELSEGTSRATAPELSMVPDREEPKSAKSKSGKKKKGKKGKRAKS